MNIDTLQSIYQRNYHVIKASVKDISDADSRLNPQLEGNNINWVLGHIVAYRSVILKTLGEVPFWDEDSAAPYSFDSEPLAADKGMPFSTLVALFDEAHDALLDTLKRTPDHALSNPQDDGKTTLGRRLEFYAWHEGYHAGQLTLLRRIVGKGSAF